MSPIQQMLLGVGAVATKTYVDDVFHTRVYTGNNSNSTAYVNGIDNSTEGGLLWVKARTASTTLRHYLHDTVRGAGKRLNSDGTDAESTAAADVTSFNSNGYTLGGGAATNSSQDNYAAWNFRRAPGFFDVVTYTGNGTAGRTVSHSLGSVPGMVIIKKLNESENWNVWHKSLPLRDGYDYTRQKLNLNTTTPAANLGGDTTWNDTKPSATAITLGTNSEVNQNNGEYVAYFFAGGESTNALARSVDFDGSNDYVSINPSGGTEDDLKFGSSNFTVEFWAKPDNFSNRGTLYDSRPSSGSFTGITIGHESSSGQLRVYMNADSGSDIVVQSDDFYAGQWQHIAVTRSSGTVRLFINGVLRDQATRTSDMNNRNAVNIGNKTHSSSSYGYFNGEISNFRVLKYSQYQTSFKPSVEPLTATAFTTLLCCNNSSTTGSTVTPGTITNNGATASTDSPFDDPAGFKFGDAEDQNVIKCGSYVGNNSNDGPHITLGFEPQFLMVKCSTANENWEMYDNMRGVVDDDVNNDDALLKPNTDSSETLNNRLRFTSTGFQPTTGSGVINDPQTYTYIAIRRSDGYVGKPPSLGTGVFAMDAGNDSSTIPCFDSNFAVDFGLYKTIAGNYNWFVTTRLMGPKFLITNDINAESGQNNNVFDSNVGFAKSQDSAKQAWMWKRHAGFDVVTYTGNGVQGRDISHSLGVAPNMMWVKNRTRTAGGGAYWNVYVSGITQLSVYGSDPDNFGNNPVSLRLNDSNAANFSGSGNWDHTHPTSTHFTVGDTYTTNQNGESMIAMLFASVDGISKVGSYDGSNSSQTISTGFAPRLVIIKKTNDHPNTNYYETSWVVLDTTRGWGSGNDNYIYLNRNDAQAAQNMGTPTSTGFTVENVSVVNTSGAKYIYYAHA